jgi:tRNA(His) 5'-end guanylyltransferase
MKDSLGDRMKGYENAYRVYLPKRMPVLVRIDGKAFHTYTKGLNRPWDLSLEACMDKAAIALCEGIQGSQIAYVQSDEISILIHNYKTIVSEAWFDNNLQKIVSVSSSIATRFFNKRADNYYSDKDALFDSRVWVLPESEVCNYFIWRQQDATRNSISMFAQSLFSHKQLQNKKMADMQDMCYEIGHNWHDLPTRLKRGRCVVRKEGAWVVDRDIPIFTQDRKYIEGLLVTED